MNIADNAISQPSWHAMIMARIIVLSTLVGLMAAVLIPLHVR